MTFVAYVQVRNVLIIVIALVSIIQYTRRIVVESVLILQLTCKLGE